jgi:hypothetical protein
MRHQVLTLRPRQRPRAPPTPASVSETTTPATSAYPSAYPSEADSDSEDDEKKVVKPFPFLQLPSEIRLRVYDLLLTTVPDVIDLDPDNYRTVHRKIQGIFWVNKQIHDEASHLLYSTKTFRIFPCHPGRFFKTKKPLLARLSPRCRNSLSTLELRLGPGFANPPKGWVVNDALGLKDCKNVRILKVVVQVDTSNPMFNGFRAKGHDEEFYEKFSKGLLEQVLKAVSSVTEVQFDAWPSVLQDGPMMTRLLGVAREEGKTITWGPECGWRDISFRRDRGTKAPGRSECAENAQSGAGNGSGNRTGLHVLPQLVLLS